jgi:hypothetical protein
MVPGLDTAGQASKAQLPDSGKLKIFLVRRSLVP